MIEKTVEIRTKAGAMDSFICHPKRPGPWPVVLFYMDAPGIREELRDMARRIATVGYYVVLPNLFYRHGERSILSPEVTDPASVEHQRMFQLMGTLSNALIAEDTQFMLDFIDADPAARKERIAAIGYCMSGPFAVTVAARFPRRIAAAASIHGVALVTDKPDSPHRVTRDVRGEVYFGWAEHDAHAPLDQIAPLRAAFEEAHAKFEIEVYPKTEHGFVFPSRYCYDKPAAERHWERLFELFGRALR
jgi:carboxymethylenebutenolidase